MNQKQNLEEAYVAAHARALQAAEAVRQMIEDLPAPDSETRIGWDHVGTLRHYAARLEELLESNEPEDNGS
ncbi:hypothetical protein [Crateriforma conspicua]|uniref:hypothetical protein n=1 Tax=Crateriforma conspicua TaxID=2527996 RepID=UPI001188C493|nr:hypothetical protein [Crateriforma conspicua]QDV62481.1 hypothetical protein Mal65_16150 [Crateriforma conspicua]